MRFRCSSVNSKLSLPLEATSGRDLLFSGAIQYRLDNGPIKVLAENLEKDNFYRTRLKFDLWQNSEYIKYRWYGGAGGFIRTNLVGKSKMVKTSNLKKFIQKKIECQNYITEI